MLRVVFLREFGARVHLHPSEGSNVGVAHLPWLVAIPVGPLALVAVALCVSLQKR